VGRIKGSTNTNHKYGSSGHKSDSYVNYEDVKSNSNNTKSLTDEQQTSFERNLPKYIDFASWVLW
jgi:hypothetical protein